MEKHDKEEEGGLTKGGTGGGGGLGGVESRIRYNWTILQFYWTILPILPI